MIKKYRPWLKSFSGIFQGLSSGWFGVAFLTSNPNKLSTFEDLLTLTLNILFAILFLMLSVKTEHILEYEQF